MVDQVYHPFLWAQYYGRYVVYENKEFTYWQYVSDDDIIETFKSLITIFMRSHQDFYVIIDRKNVEKLIRDNFYRKSDIIHWIDDLPDEEVSTFERLVKFQINQ